MLIMRYLLLASMCLLASLSACAQVAGGTDVKPEDKPVDMNSPTFVPTVKVGKIDIDGDSVQYVELNKVYVILLLRLKARGNAMPTTAWCATLRRCCR